MTYDLGEFSLPKIKGIALQAAGSLSGWPGLSHVIAKDLFTRIGIEKFRATDTGKDPCYPDCLFTTIFADREVLGRDVIETDYIRNRKQGVFHHIQDYRVALREGLTPHELLDRLFSKLETEAADSHYFVTKDYEGASLAGSQANLQSSSGALAGIPTAVKDEVDQKGLRTTAGMKRWGRIANTDAHVVASLRQQGAMLTGKLNMHEIGVGVTGINPHYGSPVNPYIPGGICGGSSSASAASVAAGLFPFTLAADGGGSIRIPAALCGVYGLKPSFGRISESGAIPLCWSLAHLGPIASNPWDLYQVFKIMAAPDSKDPNNRRAPMMSGRGLAEVNWPNLRIGVFTDWFEHAQTEIVDHCRKYVQELRQRGATIVEVDLTNLAAYRTAHLVTIMAEMFTSQRNYFAAHSHEYGPDARLNLNLAQHLTSSDYVHAQRLRTDMFLEWRKVFESVDFLITPATAITSQAIDSTSLQHGESDMGQIEQLMRFVWPANLIGMPAVSFPVGYSKQGAPIGAQLIGRPWSERLLCSVLYHMDETVTLKRPPTWFGDIL